ncbi:MAG: hypothetical protein KatS3mg063_1546 [Tepidiforma sp.]|uniref:hypothetical protein n=1 Tax=Tepidiforma sp. TaxID=2682230 RepID=UPI0021DBA29D|nr:hypothetical protein [Tepidiforma sp.]GIW15693.1 MAG: hypothetical protein KatS3mg063_1546 [Tepidiforma sp.]
MSWQSPKTNWQNGDIVSDADLNRIEGNLAECGPAKVQAAGDLLVAAGANSLQRLAVGADGQVLVVSGGMPTWGSLASDEHLVMWGF